MGRKRKSPDEMKSTIFVHLPNPIIWALEDEGNPSKIITEIIRERYENKAKQKTREYREQQGLWFKNSEPG